MNVKFKMQKSKLQFKMQKLFALFVGKDRNGI